MTRVVIVGAGGLLGRALCAAFEACGDEVIGMTHADVELTDPDSLEAIRTSRPGVVVNAAAWTDVDGCARDPDRAMRINGMGAGAVAEVGAEAGALVIQVSTNEVFDGLEHRAYAEDDATNPINPYGASKLAGERVVAEVTDRYLIVRTAWLFGPDRGFPARITAAADRAAALGEPLAVVDDEWGNPTPARELATVIAAAANLAMADPDLRVLHLAGEPPASRYGWAEEILGDHPVAIRPTRQAEFFRDSRVPSHAVLALDQARSLGLPAIGWATR